MRHFVHRLFELGRGRTRLPVPTRLAAFFDQLVDRLDSDLHLLVTEHDRAEHDLFRETIGFRLDHHHAVLRTGDHEVESRGLQFFGRRVQEVLAILITDANGTDRTVERNARQRKRSRCANHRRNVGVDFRIERDHGRHDLHFVVEAIREERTDRTIDQTRGQRFLFGRTTLTLEEAARDATGSVGLLLIVDRQRKEVTARSRLLGSDCGAQHDGIAERGHDGCGGLTSHLARLELQSVGTILERFFEHGHGVTLAK